MRKLIAGTSLSGKSMLAKKLAAIYSANGRKCLILDEMMDPDWPPESFVTDDPEIFNGIFWASRNLAVFIDEAGESVGRYDKAMSMTATRGRHWGHIVHYIVQRPAMIGRNVRTQCDEVYAFQMDEDDCKALKKDFMQPALLECETLIQGEYIRAVKYGPDGKPFYQKGSIFKIADVQKNSNI